MLLDLAIARTTGIPADWAGVVVATRDGFTVSGDRTAATELFLYCGIGGAAVATRLDEMLDYLRFGRIETSLSPFGISALLHHGLVPVPHTEYRGVYSLAMGDTAEVVWAGSSSSVDLVFEYPWLAGKSRNDRQPSELTLLDLVTKATERAVAEAGNRGFLMLSSGKDSVAIALALAESGYNHIPCVTYSSGPDDLEAIVSAQLCKKLGLSHQIVARPTDKDEVVSTLTRFFEESTRPGTDLAQIPYVFATSAAETDGGAVFDGGGSDSYMGYPVTGSWLSKMRFRLRGQPLIDFAQRRFDVDSPFNYLARSRPEATLSGRTMRFHETRTFMRNAVDTREYWNRIAAETSHLDLLDLFGAVGERHAGPAASAKKHTLAAEAIGHTASLPWCDHDLADYFFNLPEEYRYDRRSGVNKVLVRSMLARYLNYDAATIGKHYFAFEGSRFVIENRDYIQSEIDSCALWDSAGLGIVHSWLGKIDSRPLLYHSLLTLFMVSGWHNHSRFVDAAASTAVESAFVDG